MCVIPADWWVLIWKFILQLCWRSLQQIAANATRVRACRDMLSLILSVDADSGARLINFVGTLGMRAKNNFLKMYVYLKHWVLYICWHQKVFVWRNKLVSRVVDNYCQLSLFSLKATERAPNGHFSNIPNAILTISMTPWCKHTG